VRSRRNWTIDRQVKLGLAGAAALAILVLAGLRGADLWVRRDRVIETGANRAASFALILSAYLRQTFSATDASLRQLALHSGRVGGPSAPAPAWTPALTSAQAAMTAIGSLTVIDAEGVIRHSTQPLIINQSRRDFYLYQRFASSPIDQLVADRPFRVLGPSQRMTIPLGRRLTRADGAFDGAIVATLLPSELREVFRNVDVGSQGLVWIFHPEGIIVLREPSPASRIGETAVGNPLFEAARRGSASGLFRGRLTHDGPPLVSAFRALEDPSLIVAASLSEEELLGEWRREVITSIGALSALAVAVAATLWMVFRLVDRRVAAERALARGQRLEAIGQFTGGVAHDFNNILTVILGNVALLKYDPMGRATRARAELDEIEHAAQRAAELTHRLLAFARRQPLHPQVVDLNSLVRALQPILQRLLGEAITLKVTLDTSPCFANVDAVQVETALMNLCANARDAMTGGGLLVIETARIELDEVYARMNADVSPGRYVLLAVSDTGVGIAPDAVARVLEPFFTTKPLGKGTGLGLSMVYGFVKQSGGHMKIYSELGHGTVVKLFFQEAQPAAPVATTPVPPDSVAANGEVILVVEDETAVRELVEIVLRGLGYTVISAPDAASALVMAREHARIDLLFTDIVLPNGTTGLELAGVLAKERLGLRVLFTSGYSEDILQHAEQAEHQRPLISKPYSREQLARAVRALLDAPASTSAAPADAAED
jgi:signal transduction histidine kinase/CheY-like chemotaxis protein